MDSSQAKPQIHFILKEKKDDEGQTIQAIEYPFMALGGLPLVGDLVKFEGGTYRIYLRNYDYSQILTQIKIYIYMIKVED